MRQNPLQLFSASAQTFEQLLSNPQHCVLYKTDMRRTAVTNTTQQVFAEPGAHATHTVQLLVFQLEHKHMHALLVKQAFFALKT